MARFVFVFISIKRITQSRYRMDILLNLVLRSFSINHCRYKPDPEYSC